MTEELKHLEQSEWKLVPVYVGQPELAEQIRPLFRDIKMPGDAYAHELLVSDVAHDFLQWKFYPQNNQVDQRAMENLVKLVFHWHFRNSQKVLRKGLLKAEKNLAHRLFDFWQREMQPVAQLNGETTGAP